MAGEQQRFTIGFRGQTLPLRAAPETVSALLGALREGRGGWYDVTTEEGTVVLDLAKVEYVRIDAHEQRVGFGL